MKEGYEYVRAKLSDSKRLVRCLEKFNELSGKKPQLQNK
jgi:hypothetical protein